MIWPREFSKPSNGPPLAASAVELAIGNETAISKGVMNSPRKRFLLVLTSLKFVGLVKRS